MTDVTRARIDTIDLAIRATKREQDRHPAGSADWRDCNDRLREMYALRAAQAGEEDRGPRVRRR